ncbi:MAG: hypothetical protein QM764_06700 [Chitinophagaceae bacterium]
MKRRTLWIIGVTTAIVTVISLNAALGSKYRMHNHYHHHWCGNDKREGESKTAPSSEQTADSTTRR